MQGKEFINKIQNMELGEVFINTIQGKGSIVYIRVPGGLVVNNSFVPLDQAAIEDMKLNAGMTGPVQADSSLKAEKE